MGTFCCVDEFLPGEGNTVVTGTGPRTGGRTFHEVGQRLFQLLGTVVSRYTAHQDWGAYTVWLLCPSKANRRYNQLSFPCCLSLITWQHVSARAGCSVARLVSKLAFITAPKDQRTIRKPLTLLLCSLCCCIALTQCSVLMIMVDELPTIDHMHIIT